MSGPRHAAENSAISSGSAYRPVRRGLRVLDRDMAFTRKPQPQRPSLLQLVREAELAHIDIDAVAASPIRSRLRRVLRRVVAETFEFLRATLGGQRLPDVELHGLGVHARRQCPAPTLELRGDAVVEHEHDDHERDDHDGRGDGETRSNCRLPCRELLQASTLAQTWCQSIRV